MFNLARIWHLFKFENPAEGIKAFKEQKRERYLSPEELQKVNAALLEEPDWRSRTYFPLALCSAPVRGTARNAGAISTSPRERGGYPKPKPAILICCLCRVLQS
jgi:hypothetical protein